MWHTSVKAFGPETDRGLRRMADRVLDGVGDARLGEWAERHGAFHLRRRLSAKEALTVGPVIDVRRTDEAIRRAAPLAELGLFAHAAADVLEEELGPWS